MARASPTDPSTATGHPDGPGARCRETVSEIATAIETETGIGIETVIETAIEIESESESEIGTLGIETGTLGTSGTPGTAPAALRRQPATAMSPAGHRRLGGRAPGASAQATASGIGTGTASPAAPAAESAGRNR